MFLLVFWLEWGQFLSLWQKLIIVQKTLDQFDTVLTKCKDVFLKKTEDYGTSWRILRPSSLTDQILIKASRIRNIEEKGEQKVSDSVETEYVGIINYCLIGMIQLVLEADAPMQLDVKFVEKSFDGKIAETRQLLAAKNHDYGEIWRKMRISSITDMILMKLMRVKQIEDNKGKTLVSEGLDANYKDIAIYSVFCLIKLMEEE